jgi:uncharacterized protein YaaR (DUF327 family)
MKITISIFFALACGYAYSQLGKVSEVKNTYVVTNEVYKKMTCKLIHNINAIDNDTLTFISMAFTDEFKAGNRGYVYLSNQNELNAFVDDFKSALSHLMANQVFETVNPKYKIAVREFTEYRRNTPYHVKKLCIHETLGGTGEAYFSLGPNKSHELLDWLEPIRL